MASSGERVAGKRWRVRFPAREKEKFLAQLSVCRACTACTAGGGIGLNAESEFGEGKTEKWVGTEPKTEKHSQANSSKFHSLAIIIEPVGGAHQSIYIKAI